MAKFNLDFIKSRRQQLGLSIADVSEFMGFKNSSVYWKHENGVHKFKAEMLPLLAKILQCEPKNFFTD